MDMKSFSNDGITENCKNPESSSTICKERKTISSYNDIEYSCFLQRIGLKIAYSAYWKALMHQD